MSSLLGLLPIAGAPEGPTQVAPSPWPAVRFMVGEWAGEPEGQAGKGTVKRSHRSVLGDKFLHEQTPRRAREIREVPSSYFVCVLSSATGLQQHFSTAFFASVQ